jgi:hypothetical protein
VIGESIRPSYFCVPPPSKKSTAYEFQSPKKSPGNAGASDNDWLG